MQDVAIKLLSAVSDQVGKGDFEIVLALRNRLDMSVVWRLRIRRFSGFEHGKWYANDMGIFRGKFLDEVFRLEAMAIFFRNQFPCILTPCLQVVVHPAQGTTCDLFAEELRPKSSETHDMRYRVGIPSFGKHGDRNNTANMGTELSSGLANRVDHFTQNFRIGYVLCRTLPFQASIVFLEFGNFGREDFFELIVDLV